MNPTSKSTLPAVLDPVVAAVMEQLQQNVNAKEQALFDKDAELARSRQALAAAEAIIQQLKEAICSWNYLIANPLCRARRSKPRSPAVRSAKNNKRNRTLHRLPNSSRRSASRIPAETSCQRILSGSKRSSPARPSNAPAASADARLRSSATKKQRCSA